MAAGRTLLDKTQRTTEGSGMSFFSKLFGGGGKGPVTLLDPATAAERLRKQEIIMIDVRTEREWRSGTARGAHTITLGDPGMAAKVLGLVEEDTSRPIVVICRSGMRSGQAAKQLVAAGFTDVSNVKGGMMAWGAANLPIMPYRG